MKWIHLVIVVWLLVFLGSGFALQYQEDKERIDLVSSPPEPYYTSALQEYGVDALRGYLQQWEWKRGYEVNVFDCTEMSAFLEQMLENEGFRTHIIVGKYNNDWHSWLEVEIAPGKYIIVEATTFGIPNSVETEKYYQTQLYKTIYDALKVSSSAFDWWN